MIRTKVLLLCTGNSARNQMARVAPPSLGRPHRAAERRARSEGSRSWPCGKSASTFPATSKNVTAFSDAAPRGPTGCAESGGATVASVDLRGGITGPQAAIQIDSCGSGGLSESPNLLVIVAVKTLTALAHWLRIPPSPPNYTSIVTANAPYLAERGWRGKPDSAYRPLLVCPSPSRRSVAAGFTQPELVPPARESAEVDIRRGLRSWLETSDWPTPCVEAAAISGVAAKRLSLPQTVRKCIQITQCIE
jgi:hypothetical protein